MTRQQWLILRTIAGGLVLAVLLLLAAAAGAQTWPRDVTGTPAAECAALDATGTPQLCGPANPLPVTTAPGALTGGAVTAQNWFESQPPGFDPFVRLDGVAANQTISCVFLDDTNIVCFGGSTPQRVHVWRSADAGRSFVATSDSANVGVNVNPQSVIRLPDNRFLLATDGISDTFFTTIDGMNFAAVTCTGCNNLGGTPRSLTINVATILATAPGFPGGLPEVGKISQCRSTNTGSSFTCSNSTITGFTGTGSWVFRDGNQQFAAPAANIWLAIGRDGNDAFPRVLRSTDNGTSWTQVFNEGVTVDPTASIACLTSTLCLATTGQKIHRSTDGGLTWTTVVTSAPLGANTNWHGIAVFDSLTAVAAGFPGNFQGSPSYYRTIDGGLTWLAAPATPTGGCLQNSGVANNVATIIARNGRALHIPRYTALVGGTGPCAYYATSGAGGTAIVGPSGSAWAIGADGAGTIGQGNPLRPVTVAPVQGPTLFNSQTTGAADTAVVVTIAAVIVQRAHVARVEASCAAGTSSLTITDAGTTVWSTLAGEIGTARFRQPFTPSALTGSTNSALVITLAACGAGNTGTLIVHADRY